MAFSNNGNNDKGEMLRVGGLWRNQTKDGKVYLSGTIGGLRVLIFENGYKDDSENAPDYILNVAQAKQKDGGKKQPSTPSL